MTAQDTTSVEIRDNAYETQESTSVGGTPVFGWDWPDEARLAAFAEQAEMADWMEQADQPVENDFEYAALYFGS